jgi:hypothetical protein
MCHIVIFAIARWVFLCFVNTEILDHFYANRYKFRKGRKSRKWAIKTIWSMKQKEKGKEDRERKNKSK